MLTMFLALDSWVELYHGGLVPMERFAAEGAENDILVRVIVKKENGGTPTCPTGTQRRIFL